MSSKNNTKTSEHKLIEWITDLVGNAYIGDDCAVLPERILVTSDTLVEGTHFLLSHCKLSDVGWKAVASNLSDIAAMAGRPRYLSVNLTLPESLSFGEFRSLFESMFNCAKTYRCKIIGGDLTRGPLLVVSLTVIGEAHENGCLKRSGARPGDFVIVSGDFGASAAGLWVLSSPVRGYPHLREAHLRPKPRLCEAWSIVRQTGSRAALIDASDGLADALIQICRSSSVGMQIDEASLPIHEETLAASQLASVDPLDWAFYGGEDYELVGTVSQSDWDSLSLMPRNPFTVIGQVTSGSTARLTRSGCELNISKCFQHWMDLPGLK